MNQPLVSLKADNKFPCLRLLLLVSLSFFSISSFAQLKANFSSNITEGCAPLVVQFSDESTGNPVWWQWYLGNSITPSTRQHPSTTYFTPGIYTIKLVIRNEANTADSIQKTSYIKVYATPLQ